MSFNIIGMGPVVVQQHSAPYINMSNPSAGMMRYNGNNCSMEVYDGSTWMMLSSGASVDLSSDSKAALEWAKAKMREEARLDELCQKYPGLAKARENYEVFKRLVENEINEAGV